jgi:hypothetical protein
VESERAGDGSHDGGRGGREALAAAVDAVPAVSGFERFLARPVISELRAAAE